MSSKKSEELLNLSTFENIIGKEKVLTEPELLSRFSKDIYYEKKPPLAVVRPQSTDEIQSIVKAVIKTGFTLSVRGGGLSYSQGYLTDRPDTIMLDMSDFNKIIEINSEDMYVHVQAGVTWNQLNEALKPFNLRTPFWGTGSGLHATVGGGTSQNAINYGSGRYGTLAESVTGLKVILANGQIVRTGSWAAKENPIPFNRYYGPDLSGLFLGDTGALGIKTEIVLQLIPRPMETSFAAFSFKDRDDFAAATGDVGRLGLVSECYGFDPFYLSERIVSTGFADDVDKLLGVATGQTSILKGMKEAFKVAAAGRRYLKDVGYSLHISIDGRDAADVDSSMKIVSEACKKNNGLEIAASVTSVMHGTPFPPPLMMLGPKGDRWVPMHGIIPHSQHANILNDVDNFMDSEKKLIKDNDLVWGSVSIPIGNSRVLVEVNLYWKDERTDMIEGYLDDSFLKSKVDYEKNPEGYLAVGKLRDGLNQVFLKRGSTHLQIGRSYPFLESRIDSTAELLKSLKKYMDPNNQINPGSLGL